MKIRTGFVSNSSSSSFIVYGVSLDKDEALKGMGVSKKDRDDQDFDSYEFTEKFQEDSGLTVEMDYESDCAWIGIDPTEYDENKTIKELKEEAKEKIKKYFKKSKCEWQQEVIAC